MEKRKHIVIMGCPAVGKLTTAKILSKRINYPIFDNSKVLEIASLLYSYESPEHIFYRNELRFDFFRRAALSEIDGLISTNVLRNIKNWDGFFKIKKYFDRCGWETLFVILKAKQDIVLQRVEENSRLSKMAFHKSSDLLNWLLQNKDHSIPYGDVALIIDNSSISAEQVTDIIINKIKYV